jgi:hypothetical protein
VDNNKQDGSGGTARVYTTPATSSTPVSQAVGGNGVGNDQTISSQEVSVNPNGWTDQQIEEWLSQYTGGINEYYDALNQLAQGDRDFVLKWINKEFEQAMGTDDQARAEFMAAVASADEERLGRIPYDYQKYTSRQLEDYKLGIEGIDRVKKRLEEDYDTTMAGKQIDWSEARQNQNESLIADRLMSGSREQMLNQGGIAGQRAAKLETAINQEQDVLEREQNRALEDIQTEREALDLQNQRNLDDLKDQYRREAVDSIYDKEYNTEKANHDYENTIANQNLSRDKEINEVNAQADSMKLPSA